MTKRTALIAALVSTCCWACDPHIVSPVTMDPADGGEGGGSGCRSGLVVLATGDDLVFASMVVTPTNLFWSAAGLHRTPICGGLTTPFGDPAVAMTGDADNLYITNGNGVLRVPIAGGASTLLSTDAVPLAIAVDDTHVYWIIDGQIRRVPKGGGPTETIAMDVFGGSIPRIMVDADNVYWSNGNAVMMMPHDGGAPTMLVASKLLSGFALDADNLYWADHDNSTATGHIHKIPRGGGEPVVLASEDTNNGLIVADGFLYWLGGAQVRKVPVDGSGPPITLFANGLPTSFAVDATSIYWTDDKDKTVKKLTPR